MVIITDESCTGYALAGHPERPQRITTTVELLKLQTELPLAWVAPTRVNDEQILRAHAPEVLARLAVPENFDADTPFFENISTLARASAAAALDALQLARDGKNGFSLMRPPGHHATRHQSMGFCYLNNIAIAALEAAERNAGLQHGSFQKKSSHQRAVPEAGAPPRVAIFDFDVHHGNGTEDILRDRDNIAFFSVHQFPAYPGTGEKNVGKNCFNYCVAPGAARETYREILAGALGDLKNFSPEIIGVSAGFDAYARDPLAEGSLLAEDFHWLGKSLREMKIPFFSLLEGGYSRDLPGLIFAYLKGVAGKSF
jgi:acetoin utilization deacetylase AcuC-like enzyme